MTTPTISTPAVACTDTDVQWFGASSRLISGQPDSRYGWLPTANGPCIVKALDADLAVYATTLLQHERRALRRLRDLGAPAPEMLESPRPDWLVTRFAGLSLQHLSRLAPSLFPWQERLGAWVHLLRRLQRMADAGVLMIDLHEGNLLLPMTQGTHGQLRLTEVTTIDHAHTLEAGMDLRRPVWLDAGMKRIAPELRQALQTDEQRFRAACQAADVDAPGYSHSRMPHERDAANRRFWAGYNAPQQLQWLLDSGRLNADRAMQFAAGVGLEALNSCVADRTTHSALKQVVARMAQPGPEMRFDSLTAAADALAAAAGTTLPLVGQHRHEPVLPGDLGAGAPGLAKSTATSSSRPMRSAGARGAVNAPGAGDGTTLMAQHPVAAPTAAAAPPPRWVYAAVALGALAGVLTTGLGG